MRWNPFKRGGGKPAPQAPSSGLGPGVSGPAGAGGGQPAPKRGVLGRIFGRKPKPAPAPEPEEPEAGGPPAAGGPGPEGGPAEGPAHTPRTYPSTLYVSASGWWQFSKRRWNGRAHGTLTGAAVKLYMDALEAGELFTCLNLIALAYDDGSDFAQNVLIEDSDVQID
ncbi:MAG: hypothetical protein ACJ786_30290 [Catenulispora sp.]